LGIELPSAIVNAINRQTEQFYLIQEYKFRVDSEAEESKRKQIEANGITAFQQTVARAFRIPTCAGAASKLLLSWRSRLMRRSLSSAHANTPYRSFSTPTPCCLRPNLRPLQSLLPLRPLQIEIFL